MKKIINWIISQEVEELDDFDLLAEPLAKEFNIDLGIAKGIMNEVIGWETSGDTIESLETLLNRLFPSVVTN